MSEKEDIITYIKRAFELREQKCYKQAIEMLYKAIAIEPDNTEILYQLGELYYLLGNYSRAIQYPEQILKIEENNIPALILTMKIYTKQDELYTAKEYAEKIYQLDKNEQNLGALLDLYGKLSLYDEIEQYFKLIEHSEKCIVTYAKICYAAHKIEEAEKFIKKGLEINPENECLRILSGKIYFDKNEFDKAKDIFANFDKNTENPEVLNYRGLFALDAQNFIDAIKNFSKASNINPENSAYSYNLGNAYYLNGWYEEAIEAYKKALFIDADNPDYRYSLAYAYYMYEEYDKAKYEVNYILENKPNYSGANVLKGLISFKEKNYVEAERILKANLANNPEDEFTMSALSKIDYELGKTDLAKKYLSFLIQKNPDNLSYKSDLSDVYIKLKEYDSAIKLSEDIIRSNPNYIEGFLIGARASYAAGNFEETKRYAQEALSVDINCAEGYYYLALVRKEEKDFEEAIECMRRAIIYDVNNAKYYAEMAEIYELSGDNKSAFEYVKEAENIDDSEEYKLLYRKYAALNRK